MYPGNLDAPKMRSVLVELENALRTERTEEPLTPALGNLDIDHILPQSWPEHWPLANGESATSEDVLNVQYGLPLAGTLTPKQTMIKKREDIIPTMGNLTLLHYGTNRAARHFAFNIKRDLFLLHSNLHLNRQMLTSTAWDESTIHKRAELLYLAASHIWLGPKSPEPQKR
jgi:hypothetical protein